MELVRESTLHRHKNQLKSPLTTLTCWTKLAGSYVVSSQCLYSYLKYEQRVAYRSVYFAPVCKIIVTFLAQIRIVENSKENNKLKVYSYAQREGQLII